MTDVGPKASKLRLSEEASKKLHRLSQRLGLRRNIICRVAVGRSLALPESVAAVKSANDQGLEFNRYTLTGEYDDVYRALVVQHEGKKMGDKSYFQVFLRNHIERGIVTLHREYERINSPVEFIAQLATAEQQ